METKLVIIMKDNRYILEAFSGMKCRHSGRVCGKNKTFTLYIDITTGDPVNSVVGRCDREDNCGYHYTPKEYFERNPKTETLKSVFVQPIKKDISFVNATLVNETLKNYSQNNFITYMATIFNKKTINQLIESYQIGTSKHWPGASIFWQIDNAGNARTGKIMLYSPTSGKRVKEPYNHITWSHTESKTKGFELSQCFFGEHLLNIDSDKPIAIVESEKTAVIASVYLPQFIWIATGGLNNLNSEKSKILKGRKVILFPDVNAFDKWQKRADELGHITGFILSDLLEKNAGEIERKNGFDLADYLIKFKVDEFNLTDAVSKEIDIIKIDIDSMAIRGGISQKAAIEHLENFQAAGIINSLEIITEDMKTIAIADIQNYS